MGELTEKWAYRQKNAEPGAPWRRLVCLPLSVGCPLPWRHLSHGSAGNLQNPV